MRPTTEDLTRLTVLVNLPLDAPPKSGLEQTVLTVKEKSLVFVLVSIVDKPVIGRKIAKNLPANVRLRSALAHRSTLLVAFHHRVVHRILQDNLHHLDPRSDSLIKVMDGDAPTLPMEGDALAMFLEGDIHPQMKQRTVPPQVPASIAEDTAIIIANVLTIALLVALAPRRAV